MVCGKGVYREGKYKAKVNEKHTKEYLVWHSMISRCYNKNYHGYNNYKDVEVCDEWLDFQTFAEWFNNNYYSIDNDVVILEKDYKTFAYDLSKNYTPNNCIFVPQCFNKMIVFQHEVTLDLPVGIKRNGELYTMEFNNKYKDVYVSFENKNEAYEYYVAKTYNHMFMQLANYQNKMPKDVYNTIYDFIQNDGLRKIHKLQNVIL